ncbi:MAG TPA: aldehyde dehydrogenase family protein [Pseudonocardiaceae bacterium]|jgi:aldehyde dehydrogenase (NAD+)|nr:aldehyde dehydrogenase family protein [Pseudonocardiaceae bacterium]
MAQPAVEDTPTGKDKPRPTFPSTDPRTGEFVGSHPVHNDAEVAARVAVARIAAGWWAGIGFAERRERLDTWRKLIARRVEDLVTLMSAETGKPADDARLELVLVITHLQWAAANAERVLRKRSVRTGMLMMNQAATIEYQPLGVIGVIGPWNYPVFTPMGSIAYALAAGNAVVFKPSQYTPGVGMWLADTFAEVVPEHPVLTVVTGQGDTGAALCRSGVDKIAFTGSGATGRNVLAECAETLTPVLMECGGKDAFIVDEDADVAAAADAAVWGAMANAGQSCAGVERVYVVDSLADEFVGLVTDRARALRVGAHPGADVGPMTLLSQVDVVRSHIADAMARGGQAVVGGLESVRSPYVEPVVLVDVPEDSIAVTDETFGPTMVINRVRDADEAVERANASRYALGAAVFAKARGPELASRLRAGMVSVNSVLSYAAVPALPFGGSGESGFGRIHGADGLREFTRAQSVTRQRFRPLLRPMSFTRGGRTVRKLLRLVRLRYGR